MQEIQIEGKDVQQAVEKGLQQMGLRRDQVEVAIIDEGSLGFLGLGARPAKAAITGANTPAAPTGATPVVSAPPAVAAAPQGATTATSAGSGTSTH